MNLRVAVTKVCCSFPRPWEFCLSAGGRVLQPLVHESYPHKWMRRSTGQSIGMSAALLCSFINWGIRLMVLTSVNALAMYGCKALCQI